MTDSFRADEMEILQRYGASRLIADCLADTFHPMTYSSVEIEEQLRDGLPVSILERTKSHEK